MRGRANAHERIDARSEGTFPTAHVHTQDHDEPGLKTGGFFAGVFSVCTQAVTRRPTEAMPRSSGATPRQRPHWRDDTCCSVARRTPLTRKFVTASSMWVLGTKSSSAAGGRGCCCPVGRALGTEDPVGAAWAAAAAICVPWLPERGAHNDGGSVDREVTQIRDGHVDRR